MVPFANVVVGGIVPGGHLDRAGAELLVDRLIGDDRHATVDDGQHDVFADQIFVAPVIRVNRDAGVAHHRLGARCGDGDRTPALDGVVQEVEVAVLFDV